MITGDEKGGVWLAKNGKRLNRDTGEFDISGPTIEEIARRYADIQLQAEEETIRAALIAMGWTPPEVSK